MLAETAAVIAVDDGYFSDFNRRGSLRIARSLASARLFSSREEAFRMCETLAWKGWFDATPRTVQVISESKIPNV